MGYISKEDNLFDLVLAQMRQNKGAQKLCAPLFFGIENRILD